MGAEGISSIPDPVENENVMSKKLDNSLSVVQEMYGRLNDQEARLCKQEKK